MRCVTTRLSPIAWRWPHPPVRFHGSLQPPPTMLIGLIIYRDLWVASIHPGSCAWTAQFIAEGRQPLLAYLADIPNFKRKAFGGSATVQRLARWFRRRDHRIVSDDSDQGLALCGKRSQGRSATVGPKTSQSRCPRHEGLDIDYFYWVDSRPNPFGSYHTTCL
jgi:hypothetical protein